MKNLVFCSVMLALISTWGLCQGVFAQDAEVELRQLFERYISAWNREDFMTIGGEIYSPPVYLFEQERTTAFSAAEEVAELLQNLRRELNAAGFSHSELRDVSVCELGGGLAFTSFQYSRYDHSGKSVGEAGLLSSAYIARRTDQGWRLVAHVMQEEARDVSCAP